MTSSERPAEDDLAMVHHPADALRSFDGREAIYIEKGALRVRVEDVRVDIEPRMFHATVREIPTRGFERTSFHRTVPRPSPLQWTIGAGALVAVSQNTLHVGYGGWSLFFAPEVVLGVVELASSWDVTVPEHERYHRVIEWLGAHGAYEKTGSPFEPVR